MMRIRTRVGPSCTHGLGCFSLDHHSAGTLVWVFHPGFDLAISAEIMVGAPEGIRSTFERYGCLSRGFWFLCADDARFVNHSSSRANIGPDLRLTRDVGPGDELLMDYSLTDERFPEYAGKMLEGI